MPTLDKPTATLRPSDRGFLRDLLRPAADVPTAPVEKEDFEHFLLERYHVANESGMLRKTYYALKPVIPRAVQIAMRRRYAQIRPLPKFPGWPYEPLIADKIDAYFTWLLREGGCDSVHWIGMWPEGKRFALALTHDVEWGEGLQVSPDLQQLEVRLGYVSSWNLVAERYPIDWSIVQVLRQNGGEIGIHGLKHDGITFKTREIFEERKRKIHDYMKKWNVAGFRSPSTLRHAEWMKEFEFEYDSSFPDSDPYEPQPGGCCSVWPFFLGSMVELPLSMAQDHTLFVILQHEDIRVWQEKADWIAAHWGLVLINIHPDYVVFKNHYRYYQDFLTYMKEKEDMWHALPRDIAKWWRDRDASTLTRVGDRYVVQGPAAERAVVMQTSLKNGALHHTIVR
jgi:hypothetical protein